MRERKCNWCSTTWNETMADNPTLDNQQVALKVMAALEETQKAAHCEGKKCLPYRMAKAISEVKNPRNTTPLRPPELPTPEGLQRGYEKAELTILDQVFGHPDKFTAHSAVYGCEGKRGCRCPRCVDVYNSWVELYAQGDEEKLKLKVKRPLFNQKHLGEFYT